MMVCDALEALGLRGKYAIKINSRKFLNGILRLAEVDSVKTGAVLRALDKFDRLGETGVRALLGEGRKDESGDFTKGAGLTPPQITQIMRLFMDDADDLTKIEGFSDLRTIREILARGGYESDRIAIDLGIIRGLEYYTGPVFEAQLTFPVKNEDGEEVVFGSVAGGGRYDDLVARFTGQQVPATGISIGVSRLLTALRQRGLTGETKPLIVILSLDDQGKAFQTARELREQGFRAEAYVGTRKFGDQLKYADKRGAALAVIEGADERASGKITIKNLVAGAAISKSIESREEWLHARQAQVTVDRGELVKTVREMLAAHT